MRKLLFTLLMMLTAKTFCQSPLTKVLFITTSINETNNSITLKWNKIATAAGYSVSRKLRNDTGWVNLNISTTNDDTTFTDIVPNPTVGYEYQVVTRSAQITASGCVYAAIKLPPQHYIGRLIVLIDSAYINVCQTEINQYLTDIIKDGWNYNVRYVNRTTPPKQVKQYIKTMYEADAANTKGVFILGHVAVPYSGDIYPDGHTDHFGAWPADSYYNDTTFTIWTDSIVNLATASRVANRNIPGDGKFDPWEVKPANVKMFVTRVDLFDMPAINSNDSVLIKNYLIKDHKYRSYQNTFRMRALIDDNFGYFGGEAFSQNGYRNGGNLLGRDSVFDGDYFTSMNTADKSYLWSFGCGAGNYSGANGIGGSNSFQTNEVRSVFTMLFGSYFGDWDNTNNFLRAPLAGNNTILTNCWAGRPNWFFHAMGLGECIGFTAYAQAKTPAKYVPSNYGSNFIHVELLGDPTLKMYVYDPPKNLTLSTINNPVVNLSWTQSTDPGVIGYYIYRTNNLNNKFTLLQTNPVTTLSFTDNNAPIGKNYYLVRAVKLQITKSSGSFYNLSAGILDSVTVLSTLPVQIVKFFLEKNNWDIHLHWKTAQEYNVDNYEVMFSTDGIMFTNLKSVKANQSIEYSTIHQQICKTHKGKTIYYKLRITDKSGKITYSNIITTSLKGDQLITINENPVNNILRVSGTASQGYLRIIDVNGKAIKEQKALADNTIMNVEGIMPGFYYLHYITNDTITTIKFIKN